MQVYLSKIRNFSFFAIILLFGHLAQAQSNIKGQAQDKDQKAISYATLALYNTTDSAFVKAEITDDAGLFKFEGIQKGNYYLIGSFVGFSNLVIPNVTIDGTSTKDLGVLKFSTDAVELDQVTVTARRPLVEVKPDRTVFNVQGTINSAGSTGLELLRKAPGVTLDNNENVNVMGRAGVIFYVDGKRLPLAGQDLRNYLQNLTADQIDRIDIITNPGARYEAEGNAGIIDIRLKKDKNLGGNGSVSLSSSQGEYNRSNLNVSGNYRNKKMNAFANGNTGFGKGYNTMDFSSIQNGIAMIESNRSVNEWDFTGINLGTDFFIAPKHTIGFIVGANTSTNMTSGTNTIQIGSASNLSQVDSLLRASSIFDGDRQQYTANVNYRFDNQKGNSVNVDADYGLYTNDQFNEQPNLYYDASGENLLSEVNNGFETPTDISIATFKIDVEREQFGGQLGFGTKLSQVVSDNTFLVFDRTPTGSTQNDFRSNKFRYDERVYAGYVSYARKLSEKINLSTGLRMEKTDAKGDLKAFLPQLQKPPVILDYYSWFPNAGLTYQAAPMHSWLLSYGRRINRPDYNVLNPFNNQLSQISYERGNPFLRPEIVNNLELGYTFAYRYNFKLAYSYTTDQITRLIAPGEGDPRATSIFWENLAEQTTYSLNISAPFQPTKKWSSYWNLNASYLINVADYGNGAIVDLSAYSYNIYQQQTIDLPKGFKGEISGWYSGPGIWGGVFRYDPSFSLGFGLQKKFLEDQLNVKLATEDVFYESGWSGTSEFSGLKSKGRGNWDSRRVSLSMSYNFGNQNVKVKKRSTGLEDEAGRVKSGN